MALLCAPIFACANLIGPAISDSPETQILARIAGVALTALGVGSAKKSIVWAMTVYNIGAAIMLCVAALTIKVIGLALYPALILHAGMGAWCVYLLVKKEG